MWDWGFGVLDIAVVATGVGYVGKVAVVGAVKAARGARQARNAATRLVCSFAAGTLVATPEGLKPIEDVHAEDWVLARDPRTGALEPKRVTFAYSSIHEDVLVVTVRLPGGDEELVITTSEHPYHVQHQGWIPAGDLTVDDVLVTLSGEILPLQEIESLAEARTAFNFEVADFHTYGVGNSQAWVHNNCIFSEKIRGQVPIRGWNENSVRATVSNPHTTRASRNKARGNPATEYYQRDGSYVVVDDVTDEVIQVSRRGDPGWIPDSEIQNPYRPNRTD